MGACAVCNVESGGFSARRGFLGALKQDGVTAAIIPDTHHGWFLTQAFKWPQDFAASISTLLDGANVEAIAVAIDERGGRERQALAKGRGKDGRR